MLQKEVKVAKNAVKLLNLCSDLGLSHQQILTLIEPIGKAKTIKEKEDTALKLIEELNQKQNS